jgi:hypothetical protein
MAILLYPYQTSKIRRLRHSAQETSIGMQQLLRPARRGRSPHALWLPALLAASTLSAAGCSNSPTTPTDTTTPTAITETYDGTLTVNGAVTQPFAVSKTGTVVGTVVALDPSDASVSIALGTWNGAACSVVIANDNAVVGSSVTGAATATGNYCARVSDAGKLTQTTAYQISITHY